MYLVLPLEPMIHTVGMIVLAQLTSDCFVSLLKAMFGSKLPKIQSLKIEYKCSINEYLTNKIQCLYFSFSVVCEYKESCTHIPRNHIMVNGNNQTNVKMDLLLEEP